MLFRSPVVALQHHDWPGNVRELQNCLERAIVLADDTIQPGHLQLSATDLSSLPAHDDERPSDPWEHIDLSGSLSEASRRVLAEVERRKIASALSDVAGDRVRAAELLQVPLRILLGKIREYQLE